MPWLQIRLAITPDQASALEDQLLELGAVSVTFMDAEDQPIFEPDLGTTPLWSHTHLLALFEDGTDGDAVLAHLSLLRGGELGEAGIAVGRRRIERLYRQAELFGGIEHLQAGAATHGPVGHAQLRRGDAETGLAVRALGDVRVVHARRS